MLNHSPQHCRLSLPPDKPGTPARSLAYLTWGNAAHPAVLCVHGLTRNGRDFDYLADALASEYFVICPDMAGRGESDPHPDASFYQNLHYLSDIRTLLASLGVARVHWVGTSMGGIVGMLAAQLAPEILASLTLNDIGCVIPATGLQRIKDIALLPTRFTTYAEGEAVLRARCATFGVDDEEHWQHLLRYGLVKKGADFIFTYDPAIFAAMQATDAPTTDMELWSLWPGVQQAPVLLIRGATSDILTDATAKEMQRNHGRLTYLEFADAGHAPSLMSQKHIAPIHEWIGATERSA